MIDVTALTGYLYCPRKLFLERVLKLDRPFNKNLLLGKIKHELMQRFVSQVKQIVLSISSLEEIETRVTTTFNKICENLLTQYEVEIKAREIDFEQFSKQLKDITQRETSYTIQIITHNLTEHTIFGVKLWDQFYPKYRAEVYLVSKNLQLKGKVDRLEQFSSFSIPVEIKFSANPRIYETHKIQVGAYLMLLQESGYPAAYGEVYFPNAQKREKIAINPFLKHEIEQLILKTKQLLTQNSLPDYCNKKEKCNACEFRIRCYDEEYMASQMAKLKQAKDLNTS